MLDKRITFIDVARGFAMVLIVFGHTIVYSKHCGSVYTLLYSFHVALFFIISGYTYKPVGSLKRFLKKKFERIMIPYFIWNVIFLCPYIVLGQSLDMKSSSGSSFNVYTQIVNIIYGNGNNFALKQNSSLWFLPALFSMELIFCFLEKNVHLYQSKYRDLLIVIAQLGIGYISLDFLSNCYLPWGINTVLQFGIFFSIGYYLNQYQVINRIKMPLLFNTIMLMVGFFSCFCNYKRVSAIDYSYGNYILAILSGVSLSLFVLRICYKIDKSKIFEYIGKNTMGILIFHKLIVIISQSRLGVISSLLKDSNVIIELFTAMIISFISIGFSLVINNIIKRFCPVLLGIIKKVGDSYE